MAAIVPQLRHVFSDPTLVVTHVALFDGTGAPLQRDVNLAVSKGRLVSISGGTDIRETRTTRVVDGRGKYLIPGLWDAHVHVGGDPSYLTLLVANGVTALRDMEGSLAVDQDWRHRIAEQSMIGPQIFASGPILDGPQPVWPTSRAISNPEQAKQVVDELSQEKADFLKVYSLLPRAAYFALAEEANRVGIRFAGHVPFSVTVSEAVAAGQASIEHVGDIWFSCSSEEEKLRRELLDAVSSMQANPAKLSHVYFATQVAAAKSFGWKKATLLFSSLAQHKTFVVPTLVVLKTFCGRADTQDDSLRYVPLEVRREWGRSVASCSPLDTEENEGYFLLSLSLVHTMWTSGVKIAAGTDAPEPFVVPGFSIHEELELLARAGLPTSEVLRIATQGSAELVGASETMGTIAVGKRADFLLLNANPLEDIRNTRRIDTVVAGGEFLSPVSLQTLLQRSLPESDLRSQDTISLNQAD